MNSLSKGLLLAALECVIVLSLAGKLLYDRATCPRVWVQTLPLDPNLPLRGRYLDLRLAPHTGTEHYAQLATQRVLFFLPEHTLPFEKQARSDLWVEVTIPRKGPPRPIQLGLKKDGRIEPLQIN